MTTKSQPRLFFIAREQTFRISGTGLMPQTVHYLYFERQRVNASNTKMVGGKLGDVLITDSNGTIEFDFFYDSGVTSAVTTEEEAKKIANLLVGMKEVVLTNIDATTLPTNFRQASTSYLQSEIYVSVYVPPPTEYEEIQG